MYPVFASLRNRLIVSCQAGPEEPLHCPIHMAAMARAAQIGGAAAIRANGPEDIAAIRAAVNLPILGIYKQKTPGFDVFITPTFEAAQAVIKAGAQIVALDGTTRARPKYQTLRAIITRIHNELNVPVMADVSCVEDAVASQEAGADWIGTTLAGYTEHGRPSIRGPDLELISILVKCTEKPVIAEGRFIEPTQVTEAFARGAYAVVVGSAITRPQEITRHFADACPGSASSEQTTVAPRDR
jgi:N-acylglucosamine-6-phosphate 2-epimerase